MAQAYEGIVTLRGLDADGVEQSVSVTRVTGDNAVYPRDTYVVFGGPGGHLDYQLSLTREQLRELRDALDAELFVDELEEALGGTGPELIKERL